MENKANIISITPVKAANMPSHMAEAIAAELDTVLEQMIERLEAVSTCQQTGPASIRFDEIPIFAAFCAGLETIASSLFPFLKERYSTMCKTYGIKQEVATDIYSARARAFSNYLMQLASVHGLAFEGAPEKIGAFEKGVLASLEAKLRIMSVL